MQDINNRIRERIEEFVSELDQLVRQAAVESVSQALGDGGGAGRRSRGGRPARTAGRARGKGAKRPPDEIAATVDAVRRHVQKSPGAGVEVMAKALGRPTRELVLPIKKLIAAGELRTTGEKRATKYFPGRRAKKG